MADKELTDEQAAKMEEQLNAHRLRKQRERDAELRAAAKPLTDIVSSDGFKQLQESVPVLEGLGADTASFPDLHVHVNALRLGLIGISLTAAQIPAEVPASQQIVDNP